ncbi:DUF349 domain-containing protein, partial [Xanthovirga aplysinae]|uniref:DUF349 domain-containing protein n=1 Tax=Xanthovirga aplysinae TaxID=2529853 RepID=UPI0012BD0D37
MDKERAGFPEEIKNEASETPQELNEDEMKADIGEDSSDQNAEEEISHVDYATLSKEELVREVEKLVNENNIKKLEKALNDIKPVFDKIRNQEKEDALKRFLEDGGEVDDFEFREDELVRSFNKHYKALREKRSKFYADQERSRQDNLKAKNVLLARLRELVDGEESHSSINALKEMQEQWKTIGAVPPAYVRELWANYNALIDRFYNKRGIYFELKELDRKKNLDAKIVLCEKAEKLDAQENITLAVKELNELHEEFKHIGPVPRDDQEELWQRFKSASDKIYAKRKHFLEDLKKELEANLVLKEKLGEEVQDFLGFDSDRINEWNKKTHELLETQKKWEAIGGIPKDRAKEVNKKFWGTIKTFFHNKSAFFKRLEATRHQNLQLKEELVNKAIELQDSSEWDKVSNALKGLQRQWKEIGPVPEKNRDEVYARFKAACDHFFNRMREKNNEAEQQYADNLREKEQICDAMEQKANDQKATTEELEELAEAFQSIGFVPRENIRSIQDRFRNALGSYIAAIEGLNEDERDLLKVKVEFGAMKDDPASRRKLQNMEQGIRKKITSVENDITLWRNNLEFFAASRTADKLREEFE